MSNVSVVMVGWCGIDEFVKRYGKGDDSRWREVVQAFCDEIEAQDIEGELRKWTVFSPCPSPRAIGRAVEFLAISHQENFDPRWMLKALARYSWSRPEEVVILWKDEHFKLYRQDLLLDYLANPREWVSTGNSKYHE